MRWIRFAGLGTLSSGLLAFLQGCTPGELLLGVLLLFGLSSQVPTLTVEIQGTGSGTVISTPAGIDCGSTCSEQFAKNTEVTLTATPDSGSTFVGWSGDADCADGQVTMNADKTCTATFTLVQWTLTITGAGTGSGTVSAAGINCTITAGATSGDCSESNDHGTNVTLTATPDTNSGFLGWIGCDSTFNNQCTVTLTSDRTVTAEFSLQARTLTIQGAGTGKGTVTNTGINCQINVGATSGDCTETVPDGSVINLITSPDTGSVFANWSGDPDCTAGQVTMDADKTCTATFDLIPNQPPTADAGPNQTVNEGMLVTLDGSGSSDPDSDPLTYSWTQTAGPAVTLSDATAAQPTFTAPAVGTGGAVLTFQLIVDDGKGGTDTDTVDITVDNVPTVLFMDDFEDGDASDWTVLIWGGGINHGSPSQEVELYDGTYVYSMQGGAFVGGGGGRTAVNGLSAWTDYTLTVDMEIIETRHGGSHHGIAVRVNPANTTYYTCFVSHNIGGIYGGVPSLKALALYRFDSANSSVPLADTTTAAIGWSVDENQKFEIKVQVVGDRIRCWFDGILAFDVIDSTYPSGGIGLETASGHNHYDNVRVTVP